MPKYLNKSNQTIFLYKDEKKIEPGRNIETLFFYPDLEGAGILELLDVKPYITPVAKTEKISLDTNNKKYEIIIKDYPGFEKINIFVFKVSGGEFVELYFNEDSNSEQNVDGIKVVNKILIPIGAQIEISNRFDTFSKLIIKLPSGANSAEILITIENTFSNKYF